MSGENIYNLLGRQPVSAADDQNCAAGSPYTGSYKQHMKEPEKPSYSTFFQKDRQYDGTNPRFYKQRDAVIGKNVSDSVDPKNFLKRGEGPRAVVPSIHEEKVYRNPPLPDGASTGDGVGENSPMNGRGAQNGNGNENAREGSNGAPGNYATGGGEPGAEGPSGNAYSGFIGGISKDGRMGIPKSQKNFIAANITEMSNMVPKNRKDQPQYATDRKDFGKVPEYLNRVKGEVQAEKNFVRSLEMQKSDRREQIYNQYVYRLPPAEQADILRNLERKLSEKRASLASMPFSIDTVSASRKKTELERAIKEIESASAKLAKEAVFVYRDDPVNGQWAKNAAIEEVKKYAASPSPVQM